MIKEKCAICNYETVTAFFNGEIKKCELGNVYDRYWMLKLHTCKFIFEGVY